MAKEPTPLWRRAFDAVEKPIAERLEPMVQTEQFADAVAVVQRLQGRLQRAVERRMRQYLDFWNLPVGGDIKQLQEQIASLERRVRDLSKRLEDERAARRS